MICHKYKCIFIHIPKTAGSTIERIFELNGEEYKQSEKHLFASQAKLKYRRHWERYLKFSVIRNPWDRLFSVWYNYKESGVIDKDLKDFIKDVKNGKFYLLSPQINWIGIKGKVCVDFVERFEDIPEVFDRLIDKFNFSVDIIPHLKFREEKGDYRDYYCNASIDEVSKMYNKDIEIWNYCFDGEKK